MGNIPAKISGKYASYDINTPSPSPSLQITTATTGKKESSTTSSFKNNMSFNSKQTYLNDKSNKTNENHNTLKSLVPDQRTTYLLSQTIDVDIANQEKVSNHDDEEEEEEENKENFTIYDKKTLPISKKLYNIWICFCHI